MIAKAFVEFLPLCPLTETGLSEVSEGKVMLLIPETPSSRSE